MTNCPQITPNYPYVPFVPYVPFPPPPCPPSPPWFINRRTHSGRPCGPKTFIEQIEHPLKRTLHPQKRGPKTKAVTRNKQARKPDRKTVTS